MTRKPDQKQMPDADLDALFAQARNTGPVPSAALLGRIAADAQAAQETQARRQTSSPARNSSPWWRRVVAELGGVPAMGGLLASVVAGVYLGFANPDLASGLAQFGGVPEAEFTTLEEDLLSDPLLGDLVWLTEG